MSPRMATRHTRMRAPRQGGTPCDGRLRPSARGEPSRAVVSYPAVEAGRFVNAMQSDARESRWECRAKLSGPGNNDVEAAWIHPSIRAS